jgi:GH18 family chitinase
MKMDIVRNIVRNNVRNIKTAAVFLIAVVGLTACSVYQQENDYSQENSYPQENFYPQESMDKETDIKTATQIEEKTVINHNSAFKVIAYVTEKKIEDLILTQQIKRVTHVNYSFINPHDNASGELASFNEERFSLLVNKVQAENKAIFISLGGWRGDDSGYDLVYEKIAENPLTKKHFINNIIALVEKYSLDGVDLDWEYPRVEFAELYADFVIDLADALHAKNKLLTVAVIGTKNKVTDDGDGAAYLDRALKAFDWINLMAYDYTSSNHSPFSAAQQSVDYWVKQRGVPAEKAVLGLPMYARPSWRSYQEIVNENSNYACQDVVTYKGKKDFYNGIVTIAKKTRFALDNKLAGVMFWALEHDHINAKYSLVEAIVAEIKGESSSECQ